MKSLLCCCLLLVGVEAAAGVQKESAAPRVHYDNEAPNNPADCARNGGTWKRQPVSVEAYYCDIKTNDAGKPCSDTTDCEGFCVPESEHMNIGAPTTGVCSAHALFWCSSYVAHGRLAEACVD